MNWVLLVFAALGLIHALNALAPRARPMPLFFWGFFGSWLTIELVWHHVLFGLLVTWVTVVGGALGSWLGRAGFALMALTLVIFVAIGVRTRRTVVLVRGALEELDPGPDAPRFPWVQVAFPFLLNWRRGVQRVRNVPFARANGRTIKLDVTLPSAPVPGGGTRRPALMQIHGGGWVLGDKREQGLPLLNHMAAQGWVGFNVNYRLSPAVAFPAHVVDLKRGLAWIREHADEYGIDPDFICVTGGSAGGHLTAMMGLTANDPRYQPGFEEADTGVAAAVPFYGIYDFTPHGHFGEDPEIFRRFLEPLVIQAFYDEEPEKFRDASPINHVHPDAPPFLVIHGDKDTLAPVEDARTFATALKAVSSQPVLYAEMQGAQHAFEVFPSVRSARVIEGVERFLTTLWERRHAPADAVEPALEDALTD